MLKGKRAKNRVVLPNVLALLFLPLHLTHLTLLSQHTPLLTHHFNLSSLSLLGPIKFEYRMDENELNSLLWSLTRHLPGACTNHAERFKHCIWPFLNYSP